ncbi:hypothetical protein SPONN_2055 [uncultured Candidatus Thioglobus sp.]|nr:hypothetical protein SPONN_2055 [uncultured Candidatus Thioglobus sp.]
MCFMFVSFIGDALPEYLPNYTYDDYAQWQGKWELIEGVP